MMININSDDSCGPALTTKQPLTHRKPLAAAARSPKKADRAVTPRKFVVLMAILFILWPSVGHAESVQTHFDLSSPQGGPFPSDRFTVIDTTQNTGLRIHLPMPNCAVRISDCRDLEVLNTLDGFNLQPRLSIPFDGAIDVASITRQSVFLISLGSTLSLWPSIGHVVGINQIVWDPATTTLHVEADEFLDQHTRYVFVVTKAMRSPDGKHVKAAKEFLAFTEDSNGSSSDPVLESYRTLLQKALVQIDKAGIVSRDQVVVASVFTTQSITAVLEKIRDQIKVAKPVPPDFLLGPGGSRTVFARNILRSFSFNRQLSVDPAAPLSSVAVSISVLDIVPGAVGTIAFGKYRAFDYRMHPGEFIPPIGTRSGIPLVQGSIDLTFVLFLPSSPKPAAGYPVAIYGHGGGGQKPSSGLVAAKLAERGIATIAIDGPGRGFGPLSSYTVTRTDLSSVTFPSGGRSIDQNGDGQIADGEGCCAAPPRTILGTADGYRQQTADNMQLVREIEVGMDVDGDATTDLDPSRIYYVGSSSGGHLGAILLAIEPSIHAGVLTAPGSSAEPGRLAVARFLGRTLQSRIPSLINSPGITTLNGIVVTPPYFDENLPLRNGTEFSVILENGTTRVIQSPMINTVASAMEIQQVIENNEWASQVGDATAYAPYLRRKPLDGTAKSVIVQFANGDRVVPNPLTIAFLRAGDLAERATFVRTNLIFPVNPTPFADTTLYPHVFMTNAIVLADPNLRAIALKAQHQIASFFATDGTQIIDPDDSPPILSVPIFEVALSRALPEGLNYFP